MFLQDWPRNWLFSRQATVDSVGESGFHWLTPLWTYRDTEVRAAGVGIAVALTTTEAGRITMTTQCQHITGGIWGAAFSILLDQSECSLVREQVLSHTASYSHVQTFAHIKEKKWDRNSTGILAIWLVGSSIDAYYKSSTQCFVVYWILYNHVLNPCVCIGKNIWGGLDVKNSSYTCACSYICIFKYN